MKFTKISSPKNERIKFFARLKDRRARERTGLFLVDGEREVERAIRCGLYPEAILITEDKMQERMKTYEKMENQGVSELIVISDECARKISVRENPSKVIGVFRYPKVKRDINSVDPGKDAICLCIIDVEKPGNIGAIIRTAEAFEADFILVSERVDIFNPNIIRNSLGTVFGANIFQVNEEDALAFLRRFFVISADPKGDELIWDMNPEFPVAVILGAEDKGISPRLLLTSHQRVRIPTSGIGDSLNVSVAAGVFLYELVRIRNQKKQTEHQKPVSSGKI